VKIAYLFSRYYPLVVSPFLFWGFLGDHEESVCNLSYHALYACLIPTVRSLILPARYSLKLRYRPCPHNVSYASSPRLHVLSIHTWSFSHPDVAFIRILREKKTRSCRPFSHFLHPRQLRRVGDKQGIDLFVSRLGLFDLH
jgi:hypothetical protein